VEAYKSVWGDTFPFFRSSVPGGGSSGGDGGDGGGSDSGDGGDAANEDVCQARAQLLEEMHDILGGDVTSEDVAAIVNAASCPANQNPCGASNPAAAAVISAFDVLFRYVGFDTYKAAHVYLVSGMCSSWFGVCRWRCY
jgi:hypothetical protein